MPNKKPKTNKWVEKEKKINKHEFDILIKKNKLLKLENLLLELGVENNLIKKILINIYYMF
jgi:hypothetical protein